MTYSPDPIPGDKAFQESPESEDLKILPLLVPR